MGRITCFGEALIDFLAQPGTTADAPMSFLRQAGGAPANVAVAVATLGADAAFVGMLGADMFGDFLLQSLTDAGVDTTAVRRTTAAKTALAFVSLDGAGERSFSFYRPPAADLLFCADDFEGVDFAAIHIFHVCSNSLTDPAIAACTAEGVRRARAQGAIVSFDMNLRPMLWLPEADPLPLVWRTLDDADIVKLSAEELGVLAQSAGSATQVLERLWAGAARLLIVTDGGAPLRWYTPRAQGSAPVCDVRVLDSTAAGDAFVGGLLTSLAEQQVRRGDLEAFDSDSPVLQQALRFGAACGALAVTRRGAFAAMPHRDEVTALMRTLP